MLLASCFTEKARGRAEVGAGVSPGTLQGLGSTQHLAHLAALEVGKLCGCHGGMPGVPAPREDSAGGVHETLGPAQAT